MGISAHLVAVVVYLVQLLTIVASLRNFVVNPGFEDDLTGWSVGSGGSCEIVTDNAHSGTKAIHCVDSSPSTRFMLYQFSHDFQPGVKFNVSGWIKLKNMTADSQLMLCSEKYDGHDNSTCAKSSTIPECQSGTCTDDWYYMSSISTDFMPETETCLFAAVVDPAETTGEFWLDDVVIQPAIAPILGFIETSAWRQEVYDGEKDLEIHVVLFVGHHFKLTVDIVNSDGHVVDTIEKFELSNRDESYVATFKYDASKLKEGFYNIRANSVNELLDDYEETIETNLHRLEKKRDKRFYVDQKTMVAYDNGKPFFPLGIYIRDFTDAEIDLLIDSPFNIVIGSYQLSDKELDHVYERSGGRIRVINNLPLTRRCSPEQYYLDEFYKKSVEYINSWKNSKGFFGYYITDEPDVCHVPFLRNITLTIRELDPSHVTYTAIDKPSSTHIFKEAMDVFGVDFYPVQYFAPIQSVYSRAADSFRRTCFSRPMWNIPQIHDVEAFAVLYADKRPYDKINISDERPPTEQQLRQMSYQFIAAGGMGFMYFRFDCLKQMEHKNPFDKEWAKVKKVVKELADEYVPIIISGIQGTPRFTLPHNGNYIGRRVFYYEGYSYILIVNNCNFSQNYSFFKPDDIAESDLTMIMGSSKMTFENNTVTLEMPPIDVVWLRVLDKKWVPASSDSSVSSTTPSLDSSIKIIPGALLTYLVALIVLALSISVVGL